MDYQPTTRYPSLQLSRHDGEDPSPVLVDGLDVVDEQVVLLSPLEPRRRIASPVRRSPVRRTPQRRPGGSDGLG